MPFFAPYLASEGLLRAKGYSDSPPPLRRGSEAKYGASPNSFSLAGAKRRRPQGAEDAPRFQSRRGNLFLSVVV